MSYIFQSMKIPTTKEIVERLNSFKLDQPRGAYTRLATETGLDIFYISKVGRGFFKDIGIDRAKLLTEAMDKEESET